MNSPLQAALWRFYRTNRMETALRIGSLTCLLVLVYWPAQSLGDLQLQAVRGVAMLMLLTATLFSSAWLSGLDGTSLHRVEFVRPISTIWMVLVPMSLSILSAMLAYVLPVACLRGLFDAPLPLLGPMAWIMSAVSCCSAPIWAASSPRSRWLGFVAGLIFCSILVALFHWRHQSSLPFLLALGDADYFQFHWYEFLLCLVITGLSLLVAVIGVDHQRHGLKWPWFRHQHEVRGRSTRARDPSTSIATIIGTFAKRPFRSPLAFRGPLAAQIWFELRRVVPTVAMLSILAPMLILAFCLLCPLVDPEWNSASYVWLVASLCCPLLVQFAGADRALGLQHRQGTAWLSSFDASRPVHCDYLVGVKLLVIAVCSLVGSLLMVAVAGAHAGFSGDWRAWQMLSDRLVEVAWYWWPIGLLNLLLVYIGSTSALLVFGLTLALRPRWMSVGIVLGLLQLLLAIWDAKQGWQLQPIWAALCYTTAIALVIFCLWAVRTALVASTVCWTWFRWILGLWLVYAVTGCVALGKLLPALPFEPPLALTVLAYASLVIALGTTVLAPVSLAAHRHG